ncbi:MAG: DUF3592 domain-containing protein [Acidobacteria bacterium]|nr:DUF3592 domain-containing protein [Acidobacteriota bacterium]
MAGNFRFGCLFLFSLPFAGVGTLMMFLTFSELWDWRSSYSWDEVQAKLTKVELETNQSSDSTTYQVVAEYTYDYGGRQFENSRVGLGTGADNVGDYHQKVYERLKASFDRQELVTCYVNPANPGDSLLDRELRYGMLLFYLVFVLAFGGVGYGLMAYSLFQAYTWLKSSKFQFLVKPKPKPKPAPIAKDVSPEKPKSPASSQKAEPSPVPQAKQEQVNPQAAVAAKSQWMKGRVLETEGGKKIMRRAVIAVVWNVLSIPLVFFVWPAVEEGNFFTSLLLIIPVIGLVFLYGMALDVLHWRRFGLSHLSFDRYPQAGQRFEAILRNRTLERFDKGFDAQLTARTDKQVVFEDQVHLSSDHARGGVNLPLEFEIPDSLDLQALIDWQLVVSADIPGVDFRAAFAWQTGSKKGTE